MPTLLLNSYPMGRGNNLLPYPMGMKTLRTFRPKE